MAEKKTKATVFIPTYNGEELLDKLLKSVFDQELPFPYEVFIIDSGSTDRTLEIVSQYKDIRLHQIPNEEFGHGKTRNLAAQMSDSTFMVYLTQDAVPSDKLWLHRILEPFFINDKVVAVLGRQLPWPDCVATIKREINGVFSGLGEGDAIVLHRNTSLLDSKTEAEAPSFLSDVNAAYRRDLLVGSLPFEDVDYAEDQAMGRAILERGLIKAYSPAAAVRHSHNFTVREYFYRKYDEYVGLRESLGIKPHASFKELALGSTLATLRDYRFIVRDADYPFTKKVSQLILSPGYNLALRLAINAAARSKVKKSNLSLEQRKKVG